MSLERVLNFCIKLGSGVTLLCFWYFFFMKSGPIFWILMKNTLMRYALLLFVRVFPSSKMESECDWYREGFKLHMVLLSMYFLDSFIWINVYSILLSFDICMCFNNGPCTYHYWMFKECYSFNRIYVNDIWRIV